MSAVEVTDNWLNIKILGSYTMSAQFFFYYSNE